LDRGRREGRRHEKSHFKPEKKGESNHPGVHLKAARRKKDLLWGAAPRTTGTWLGGWRGRTPLEAFLNDRGSVKGLLEKRTCGCLTKRQACERRRLSERENPRKTSGLRKVLGGEERDCFTEEEHNKLRGEERNPSKEECPCKDRVLGRPYALLGEKFLRQ